MSSDASTNTASTAAADAAARRRAKLLARGADRLAQLQQQPPPSSTPAQESSTATSESVQSDRPSPLPFDEPAYGESLLRNDDASPLRPDATSPIFNLLQSNNPLSFSSSSSTSTLLAPDRLDTASAVKALLIGLLGALLGYAGEPLLGPAISWLFVLWLVSEFSIRFAAQRLAPPSPSAPLALTVITDLTSSVYAVAGRLCVFVFAFAVTNHYRFNWGATEAMPVS